MVDGTLSKAFRGDLHPVEIGRRLTREMDLERRVGVNGLISPNAFVVHLSPNDFDRFESFLDALVRELEEAARDHARTENYVFVGPVTVSVVEDPRQRRGRFDIVSGRPRGPFGASGRLDRHMADGARVVLGSRADHHRTTAGERGHGQRSQCQPPARRDPSGGERRRRRRPQFDQRDPRERGQPSGRGNWWTGTRS